MLTGSVQHRQSPVINSTSPSFQPYQYGHSSPRTGRNPLRRKSSTPKSSPAPIRQAVQYVSRGTQYSPITKKMDHPPPVSQIANVAISPKPEQSTTNPNAPPQPPPPSPPRQVLKTESPNTKKRMTREEQSPAAGVQSALLPKRARSSQTLVKVLPAKYEHCAVDDMVILIADMISELISTNDDLPVQDGAPLLTRFHSRTAPGISVKDYLQRLAKHATLTPPLLLAMVYYIDRLCLLYPAFSITTLTVHRFLITAATVAAKGLSDSFWNNATYARVGGIKINELGLLELDFLYRVDWKIVPNPEVLVDYYRGLIKRNSDYRLETDDAIEDKMEVADEEVAAASPVMKTENSNDAWNEWMHNVSTKKGKVENENSEESPTEAGPAS